MVEAPHICYRQGKYYLFYSANSYQDGRYALGCATADNLTGLYIKAQQPWKESTHPAANGGHVRCRPSCSWLGLVHRMSGMGHSMCDFAPMTSS